MSTGIRLLKDKAFTIISGASVILLAVLLIIVLTPMLKRGAAAVVFKGTVEFREMQKELFNRGNEEQLAAETEQTRQVRQQVYALMDSFSSGIDVERQIDRAKDAYRDYGDQLRYQGLNQNNPEKYAELRGIAKDLRKALINGLKSEDKKDALEYIQTVSRFENKELFKETKAAALFEIAAHYEKTLQTVDLSRRDIFAEELAEVKEEIRLLLGPAPGQDEPALAQDRFGATRWDMAEKHLHHICHKETWVLDETTGKNVKKVIRRDSAQDGGTFAGTTLEPMFAMIEKQLPNMLHPKTTFYWQYFIDDSTPGHYFGGVGPEILGTLLLTLVSMLFAVPLGIVSAAYLVEYAGDNIAVKIIRTCINTLAGVPSIVFGLFGLAFFVNVLLGEPCILACSMTLALLVLPVIIRASEEAIRAVPHTYKEAAMGLGAGKFKTFATVTLPAAAPGILTGIILSLSRAAGETAPILFTGAVALGPIPNMLGQWWMKPSRALSYGSYDIAVGDRLAMLVPHNQYGMVTTLIVLVLCLNIVAIYMRNKLSKKLRGM